MKPVGKKKKIREREKSFVTNTLLDKSFHSRFYNLKVYLNLFYLDKFDLQIYTSLSKINIIRLFKETQKFVPLKVSFIWV